MQARSGLDAVPGLTGMLVRAGDSRELPTTMCAVSFTCACAHLKHLIGQQAEQTMLCDYGADPGFKDAGG